MSLTDIANTLKKAKENVILIYAFNATGKTRLSVAYKNESKKDKKHTGVYYNAFSEDLFVWDNDTENSEEDIRLKINPCSLNGFHSALTGEELYKKLKPFKPKYGFDFSLYKDHPEKGIEYIYFYDPDDEDRKRIKISRGEERIFVWCFFLCLFEVEDWSGKQSSHFFIDDPVSSLDDHNLFVTASTILDLIEKHYEKRKFIITTHHFGFFAILNNWLLKGEKAQKYEDKVKSYILSNKSEVLTLENTRKDVFLFHLYLMQMLKKAQDEGVERFHFALLRQLLENISSFLGSGHFSYAIEQIGIEDKNKVANIVNTLSHQNVYQYQSEKVETEDAELFREILEKVEAKYKFILHNKQNENTAQKTATPPRITAVTEVDTLAVTQDGELAK